MRNALDGAPRATCRICEQEIALVDRTVVKSTRSRPGGPKGGRWVHVGLPDDVHPATP